MAELFVISLAFVVYTYVGYPVWIALLAFGAREDAAHDPRSWPVLAVLVPAYNEGRCIGDKIRNVLASDYPGPLRIVVVCDGRGDDTAEQAKRAGGSRVTVEVLAQRRGKMAAINRGMELVDEPVVILTDADTRFAPDALRRLVARFSDPRVGAVSGSVALVDGSTGFARDLGIYQRYECWLRRNESASGSAVGVSGALFAVRRRCFRELPEDTILDDVAMPFEAVRRGYRVLYESGARAFEQASDRPGQEYARKRRTLAGNVQLMARYRDLLLPLHRGIAFRFWSHKVFRLLVPYALLGILVGSFGLPGEARTLSLASQGVFYGLALLVAVVPAGRGLSSLWVFPYTFCTLNWAAVTGACVYLRARQKGAWERVQ
ncbi:MAG: glycosyltransferase family 2 protein [Acidiferrobacteraceae bacterium]